MTPRERRDVGADVGADVGTEPDPEIEAMLTGGHPNSLGRTVEVVDLVLADRDRLLGLYSCYASRDAVVRLRVSSALKRVAAVHPEWLLPLVDGLQRDVAALDQPSAQWTLALLFDRLRPLLDERRRRRAVEVMQRNLAELDDWIVLTTTMTVLGGWSAEDEALRAWLRPHAARLAGDGRRSVATRARRLLADLSPPGAPGAAPS